MKCPFELPVKPQSYTGVLENVWYKIVANGITVISGLTESQANFLVCVINSHEKLVDLAKDLDSGLKYLRETKREPYGFGIDRLEEKLQALKEAEKE